MGYTWRQRKSYKPQRDAYKRYRSHRADKRLRGVDSRNLQVYYDTWDRSKFIQKVFPSRKSFALSCYDLEQVLRYELGDEKAKEQAIRTHLNETNLSKAQKDGAVRLHNAWTQQADENNQDDDYAPGYQFGE